MHVIAVMCQKGGSGKAMLSVNLATAGLKEGLQVAVADTDPQGSALAWAAAREEEAPLVWGVPAGQLRPWVKQGARNGIDLAIVDTPPHSAAAAATIAAVADTILIPCRPSAADLGAVGGTTRIADASGAPTFFVLNACPPRAPEVAEVATALTEMGAVVAPVTLGQRQAFARAFAMGRGIVELGTGRRIKSAALELQTLWSWLRQQRLSLQEPAE